MRNDSRAITKYFARNHLPPRSGRDMVRRKYRGLFINMINSGAISLEKVTMCACGGSVLITISEKDRFGLPFGTKLCKRCGLVFTSPRISESSLSKYYKEIYYPLVVGKESSETLTSVVREDQGERIYRWIEKSMGSESGKILNVCEVGCASGSNLTAFSRIALSHGVKCLLYGSEYEDRYAAAASRMNVRIIEGGIDAIARCGIKFDVMILSHVFEHLTDLDRALNQIKSALIPGGILYIEVPGIMNDEMMEEWYDGDYISYCVHAHTFYFNLTSLNYILARNGFELVEGNEIVQATYRYYQDKGVSVCEPHGNYEIILEQALKMSKLAEEKQKTILAHCKNCIWKMSYYFSQPEIDISKFHLV